MARCSWGILWFDRAVSEPRRPGSDSGVHGSEQNELTGNPLEAYDN
jgi:hypothetical protein